MMTSEEVAKTKWCPLTSLFAYSLKGCATVNRRSDEDGDLIPNDAKCLGSQCMAWRWEIYNGAEAVHQAGDCGFCGMATGAGG